MDLAVVFTEYQLLQVQALADYHQLDDLSIIIFNNGRIEPWLIDKNIYEEIFWVPSLDLSRYQRISKSYIDIYAKRITKIVKDKNVRVFIGAQDENTLFALIKKMTNPVFYWNIEDGFANYYERGLQFKTGIFLKKLLFKYIYGYDLPIAFAHGSGQCERSFRMAPLLSHGGNTHTEIGTIFKDYLVKKAERVKEEFNFFTKYRGATNLIITNLKKINQSNYTPNPTDLFKFHPEESVPNNLDVNYIKEKVPVEILPFILPKLEMIKFQVMSSCMLNIASLELDLNLVFDIAKPSKNALTMIEKIERL